MCCRRKLHLASETSCNCAVVTICTKHLILAHASRTTHWNQPSTQNLFPREGQISACFLLFMQGGVGVAKIGIVVAASATPLDSAYFYKRLFEQKYGASATWIPIDESRYSHSAYVYATKAT